MVKVNSGICIGYNRTRKCYFIGVKETPAMQLRIVATFNTYPQVCKYIKTLENKMRGGPQNETEKAI